MNIHNENMRSSKREKLREMLKDKNIDDATLIHSVLELTKLGDIRRYELEDAIGRIKFWSYHPQKLMELANSIEQNFPDLASGMLRKLWDFAPLNRSEIIVALKRLEAREYLVEILKSYRGLLVESAGANESTIALYGALDQINIQLNQLDQIIEALFALRDKQALSEISNDASLFPFLRDQAKVYLEKLQAG